MTSNRRKIFAFLLIAAFAAMIIYGARYQKLAIYKRGGDSVQETMAGTKIQVAAVKQSIIRTNGFVISATSTNAPGAPECLT